MMGLLGGNEGGSKGEKERMRGEGRGEVNAAESRLN